MESSAAETASRTRLVRGALAFALAEGRAATAAAGAPIFHRVPQIAGNAEHFHISEKFWALNA